MVPTGHLAAFLVTVYVVILVPGPSVVFTVSRSGVHAHVGCVRKAAGEGPAAANAPTGCVS